MSLSACAKCMDDPCICGYNYRNLSVATLLELSRILKNMADDKVKRIKKIKGTQAYLVINDDPSYPAKEIAKKINDKMADAVIKFGEEVTGVKLLPYQKEIVKKINEEISKSKGEQKND